MVDSQVHLEVSSLVIRIWYTGRSIVDPWTVVGHVVPEARLGGPIALVKDGDRIVVDSEHRAINWLIDGAEQARRKQEWDASDKGQLGENRGVLFRYARDVAVSPLA